MHQGVGAQQPSDQLLERLVAKNTGDSLGRPRRIRECGVHRFRGVPERSNEILIPRRLLSVAAVERAKDAPVYVCDMGRHITPGPLLTWRRTVELVGRTPLETGSEPLRDAGVTIGQFGDGQESYAADSSTLPKHITIVTMTCPPSRRYAIGAAPSGGEVMGEVGLVP